MQREKSGTSQSLRRIEHDTVHTVLAAGNTGVPKVGTAKSNDPESSTALSSTRKKNATREVHQTEVPLGILPPGAVWVPKEAFQHIPTVNLVDDGDPPGKRPQKTSTPIKATPATDRSHSGKKLNISKIKGAHLLFEMQDRHEKAQGRESEAKDQVATSHRVARGECSSGGELPPRLPAKLPTLSDGDGTLTKPIDLAPEASSQGKKHPLDAEDEVVELLDQDEATGPPNKKKKKKNKSQDRSKDEISGWKPRTAEHVPATQQPNPRLWPKSRFWLPPAPELRPGGDQGFKEEKEEECRTQEVPIRAERS